MRANTLGAVTARQPAERSDISAATPVRKCALAHRVARGGEAREAGAVEVDLRVRGESGRVDTAHARQSSLQLRCAGRSGAQRGAAGHSSTSTQRPHRERLEVGDESVQPQIKLFAAN